MFKVSFFFEFLDTQYMSPLKKDTYWTFYFQLCENQLLNGLM